MPDHSDRAGRSAGRYTFYAWTFHRNGEPTRVLEGDLIRCSACGEWSHHGGWKEVDVYCEVCGEHAAIRCPKCGEDFDHVWAPAFEVKSSGE